MSAFLTGGNGNGFLKISLYSGLNHLLSPAVTSDIKVTNDATRDKLLKAIIISYYENRKKKKEINE